MQTHADASYQRWLVLYSRQKFTSVERSSLWSSWGLFVLTHAASYIRSPFGSNKKFILWLKAKSLCIIMIGKNINSPNSTLFFYFSCLMHLMFPLLASIRVSRYEYGNEGGLAWCRQSLKNDAKSVIINSKKWSIMLYVNCTSGILQELGTT